MKLYAAPMEGITGYIFRNAFSSCFGQIDKYFIPFISPNQKGHFSHREKQDILPEHNQGMRAVPQILTNSAEDFIRTAHTLETYGYEEVNLNLGCPSKTVVSKGRGAGFLKYPDQLDRFFNTIFDQSSVAISVKTRIGMESADEFPRLLEIFNQYPITELIIHPRVQQDYYGNHPDLNAFTYAATHSKNPLCYNGDIFTMEDYEALIRQFPDLDLLMLGRGLLKNPALAGSIKGKFILEKEPLRRFHDQIYEGYGKTLYGEKTILFKMKELWGYLAPVFTHYETYLKQIQKAEKCSRYEAIVEDLFSEQEIQIEGDQDRAE